MKQIVYKGQKMKVFHQLLVAGRFRLYNAAIPSMVTTIEEAWKKQVFGDKNMHLGKLFTVRPMIEQVVGEEVLDNKGKLVAVFGIALTNNFVPSQEPQQNYIQALKRVLESAGK